MEEKYFDDDMSENEDYLEEESEDEEEQEQKSPQQLIEEYHKFIENEDVLQQIHLQDQHLNAVFELKPDIESLEFQGSEITKLENIPNNLKNLKKINLCALTKCKSEQFQAFFEKYQSQSNLEVIDLSLNKQMDNSVLISLSKNADKFPNLKLINLEGCSSITNEGIHSLIDLNNNNKVVLAGLNKIICFNSGIKKNNLQASGELLKLIDDLQ